MSKVLRHQIDLLGALGLELLGLAHQARQRLGAMLAAHQRNRAERAGVIAAFGDLEIADVWLLAEKLPDTGMGGDRVRDQAALRQLGDQVVQLREPQHQVDFRDLRRQLLLVALHETSDGDDRLDALFLQLGSR